MEPVQFGKYSLLERISHGGMAEVFRAKAFGEAGFERDVAIKLLLPSVATDDEFITMLIDEAKIAGQLNHANIAQIFDLGVADGRYYIVQEFVAGLDLRSILKDMAQRNDRLSVAQACHIVVKICEGLDYAHNKRDLHGNALHLVHRDISPQNILISDEGEVKLIDFGIAKAEGRTTKTMAGLVKGKFAYMSPEQIRGLPVDRRSDVFACGIVLHELIANRPLFRRKSEFETLKQARNADAPPPSQFNPECPPELDRIVLRALARHVDDRYPTASRLRDALWEFVHQSGHHYSRGQLGEWMQLLIARRPPKRAVSHESASMVIEIGSGSAVSMIGPGAADSIEITSRQPDPQDEDDYGEDEVSGDEPVDDAATLVDPMANKIAAPDDEDDYDAEWAAAVRSRRPLSEARSGPGRPLRSETPTPVFDMSELREQIEMSRPDTPDVARLLDEVDEDEEPTREAARKAHRYYMESRESRPEASGGASPPARRPITVDEPPTRERPMRRQSDGLRAVVGMESPSQAARYDSSNALQTDREDALTAPGSTRSRHPRPAVQKATVLGTGGARSATVQATGAPATSHARGRLPSISSSPPVRDDAIIEFAPAARRRGAQAPEPERAPSGPGHAGRGPSASAAAAPLPARSEPERGRFSQPPLPAPDPEPPPGTFAQPPPAGEPPRAAGGVFALPPGELSPPRARLTGPPMSPGHGAPHPHAGFGLAMGSQPREGGQTAIVGFWRRRSSYLLIGAIVLLVVAAGSSIFLSLGADDRPTASEAAK